MHGMCFDMLAPMLYIFVGDWLEHKQSMANQAGRKLIPLCVSICSQPPLSGNLRGAVSTLVLIARPTQCVPGQVQDSYETPVTVNVLIPTLNRARHSRHLHIRCLRSTALALAVPCSPMPVVTSVNQMASYQVCSPPASVCLVDHVLHGNCPDVMSLWSQRKAVACYSRGGRTSKVL